MLGRDGLSSGTSSGGKWVIDSSIARAKKSPWRMMREEDSKYRFRAEMNADSRDLAVDVGEDMRDTRMACASGIVGGGILWARREDGSERLAYSVGAR